MERGFFRLTDMTWEDVRDRLGSGKPTVIIPIGSTEQHGVHLPIGTDSFAAIDLAESAAQMVDAVVAPPVWCGWSPHHMVLPGTITIRPEVLIEYVYDMAVSLAAHGFRRFVFLNGHRFTNNGWIQIAADRVQRNLEGCKAVIYDPVYMSKELAEQADIGHGGDIETSHMLAAKPDLVRMGKARDYVEQEKPRLYHTNPRDARDTLCYLPPHPDTTSRRIHQSGGSTGRPTMASPEKGQRYREHLLRRLVEVVQDM